MDSPGSSTSSRDGSPSREVSPLARSLKPPIVLKKGHRGYGFTLKAIRVYLGDTNTYTLQHIVVVRDGIFLLAFANVALPKASALMSVYKEYMYLILTRQHSC